MAPTLAVVRADAGLEPCVFLGSWCNLRQTRGTSHVDEFGR